MNEFEKDYFYNELNACCDFFVMNNNYEIVDTMSDVEAEYFFIVVYNLISEKYLVYFNGNDEENICFVSYDESECLHYVEYHAF